MNNYLTELAVIHITLILGYWFFLRKEQQYAKIRFYLIAATLLALTIPLLKLPRLFFNNQESFNVGSMEAIPLDAMAISPTVVTLSWGYLLMAIYLVVSAFFLFKFLSSLGYLIYLERHSNHEKFNGFYIRRAPNIKGSFTFFNWIFLSDDIDSSQQEYEVILKHEKAHALLGHSYDLLFFELFKVCFWWLPTSWFVIKEIRKIHEYQADNQTLKSCELDQYSSILISTTLESGGLSLANSFHDGLIIKRLKAMKQQVKKVSPWKFGMLFALCTFLILFFACTEELDDKSTENNSQSSISEAEVFSVVEELPEFEGGMDAFYRYIGSKLRYPLQARQMGIEGKVSVEFVVEKDGSLSNVKSIKGIGAGCDAEAVRVVQEAGSFKPGAQRGKPVRVRMVLPVIFKLNHGKTNKDNSTQGMIILDKVSSNNQGKLKVVADYTNGEWSGTVYDEEGEGLPGVNIVVIGTTTGTVSDLGGTFKVKANSSKDLIVSFVGYESARVSGK